MYKRQLRNVAQRDQGVTLFGQRYASPFGIAPMGIAALSAYRGDIVLARAAAAAGIPAVQSGSSLIRLEEVMAAAPGTWFQAYLPGTPERIDALLWRVIAAGVQTLVVTVDIPVAGNRENNIRAGFSTPLRPSLRLAWDGMVRPRWLAGTLLRTLAYHGMPHFENSFAERGAPILSSRVQRDFAARDHFDWSHIAHIRRQWRGPLVVKGILSPQDAALARQHGVDGIIVSNHGGRQLDGAVAPLRVLPAIAEQAGSGMTVMLDGGIRRGTDGSRPWRWARRQCLWGGPSTTQQQWTARQALQRPSIYCAPRWTATWQCWAPPPAQRWGQSTSWTAEHRRGLRRTLHCGCLIKLGSKVQSAQFEMK